MQDRRPLPSWNEWISFHPFSERRPICLGMIHLSIHFHPMMERSDSEEEMDVPVDVAGNIEGCNHLCSGQRYGLAGTGRADDGRSTYPSPSVRRISEKSNAVPGGDRCSSFSMSFSRSFTAARPSAVRTVSRGVRPFKAGSG